MAKKVIKNKVVKKAKIKQKLLLVKFCINATFNNTIITLTDLQGKVLGWCTSGASGFKGSKKSTPFAAQKAAETVLEKAALYEATTLQVQIQGAGSGRDAVLRTLQASKFVVESIKDITGFPFGGVRARKRRRV